MLVITSTAVLHNIASIFENPILGWTKTVSDEEDDTEPFLRHRNDLLGNVRKQLIVERFSHK